MLDIANMEILADDPPVYRALMAVKPDGMSVNAWAVKAGINRSMFNAIRRHGNPNTATLNKLLDAIGVSWAQFDAHVHPVKTEVAATGMGVADVERAWRGAHGPPVPLYGSAFGGDWEIDGEDAIELTELHLSEVLDRLARPPSLAGDKEAYAVTIINDSMAPRFEPGERAFVSPRAAVSPGNDVIVQICGDPDTNGDQLADRVTHVLIKRLVRQTSSFVELRQFNPERTFRIPTNRIARKLHRVMGRL